MGEFFDRKPWYYRSVFYAVGFGVLSFLLSDNTVTWAVVGGLLFSAAMTTFDLVWLVPRRRRPARRTSAATATTRAYWRGWMGSSRSAGMAGSVWSDRRATTESSASSSSSR